MAVTASNFQHLIEEFKSSQNDYIQQLRLFIEVYESASNEEIPKLLIDYILHFLKGIMKKIEKLLTKLNLIDQTPNELYLLMENHYLGIEKVLINFSNHRASIHWLLEILMSNQEYKRALSKLQDVLDKKSKEVVPDIWTMIKKFHNNYPKFCNFLVKVSMTTSNNWRFAKLLKQYRHTKDQIECCYYNEPLSLKDEYKEMFKYFKESFKKDCEFLTNVREFHEAFMKEAKLYDENEENMEIFTENMLRVTDIYNAYYLPSLMNSDGLPSILLYWYRSLIRRLTLEFEDLNHSYQFILDNSELLEKINISLSESSSASLRDKRFDEVIAYIQVVPLKALKFFIDANEYFKEENSNESLLFDQCKEIGRYYLSQKPTRKRLTSSKERGPVEKTLKYKEINENQEEAKNSSTHESEITENSPEVKEELTNSTEEPSKDSDEKSQHKEEKEEGQIKPTENHPEEIEEEKAIN